MTMLRAVVESIPQTALNINGNFNEHPVPAGTRD